MDVIKTLRFALGQAPGVQLKRKKGDYMNKGVKAMMGKPMDTADPS